jgi:hypothetical protein
VSQVGDIRAWLKANGFARFADTFEENEIDGEALLELSEEHLKDFGTALGPRLKLLKAIQSLRTWSARPSCRRGSTQRICAQS